MFSNVRTYYPVVDQSPVSALYVHVDVIQGQSHEDSLTGQKGLHLAKSWV